MNTKRIYKIVMFTAVLAFICIPLSAAELFGPMKGLIWKAGNPERMGKESVLSEMDKVLSKNEYLSGVFMGVSWQNIEPEAGQYHWDVLDAQVEIARKYKKPYKLMVQAGAHVPLWIYQAGAVPFESIVNNPHKSNYGEAVKIPLPWDKIYQQHFQAFLSKIAERYGNDQYFVAIALTGANFMSGEMHLPKLPDDLKKWAAIPNHKQKLVELYKQLIDFYAATFPHQQICLHISVPLPDMDAEVAAIIQHGVEKYPDQFTLQSCQLSGRMDNAKLFSYHLVMENKDRVHRGFQNLAGLNNADGRQGSTELTILNLIGANSEYWELWQVDGANRDRCANLQQLWDTASKLGYEQYKAQLQKEGKYIDSRAKLPSTRAKSKKSKSH